jgi:hypothetical protein
MFMGHCFAVEAPASSAKFRRRGLYNPRGFPYVAGWFDGAGFCAPASIE